MQDTRGSLFRSWFIILLLFVSACTQVLGDFETKANPGGPALDAGRSDAGDGGPIPNTGPIIVNPTSGLVTSESGRTAQFTIVLKLQPTNSVVVTLQSSNKAEGTVSPGSVTFTKQNWNIPQTVTVTGVDDTAIDGNQLYTIITSKAASMDPTYANVDPPDVSVTNVDNESDGFTISPDQGLVTTESGGEATFTVVLNTKPKANVTIKLASNNIAEGTVAPASMVFTPDNYRSPQMATVTGVDDAVADGPIAYKIVLSPAVSTDLNYDKVDPDDVDVINEDDDTAGFTVKPTMGLVTNENGQMATFSMALNFAPKANVLVRLASSNTSEGIVSPTTLTFTTANWKAPQIVTVSGIDDTIADGDQAFEIVTGPGESGDPAYNKLDPPDVSVINVDNDSPGITVKPADGLVTTEAGGEATFTIVLNSKPSANVTIGLTSDHVTEGKVNPSSVTFTKTSWNAPQTVTITGVDDAVADGNQPYVIRTAPAVSTDTGYNGLDGPDVKVTNSDDDSAGFIVVPTMGLVTSEKGDFATFTIALTSKPTQDVTIKLSSSNKAEGAVTPDHVTFTPDNYRALQTVTVTGVDDRMEDGNQVYRIITDTAASGDMAYNGLPVPDVEVTNTDDDSAGIFVKLTKTPLETSEKGDTATFTVVLTSQPATMTTVTIPLASTNEAEGTVSPRSLVFTGDNWNAPRTVTITGVNDDVQDGNQPYRITIGAATSGDPKYNGIDVPDPVVTNIDNDVAGITVKAAAMLTTTEKGGSATFTVELNSQPTKPVTIQLTSTLPTEGKVSPPSLNFSTTDWNAPQTVTVTGVDDHVADGNQPYAIVTAPAVSDDANYKDVNPADVALTNIDDDSPGFIITPTTPLTTNEDGVSATFTVQLQSQPVDDVTIAVHSSDLTEGHTNVGLLTFTAANYNAPHTVTVTGVNDDVADGNQAYRIILDAAVSNDGKYNTLDPVDVVATNVDNDSPGFIVSAASGNTREDGTTATFTVRLTSQPSGTASVNIPLSSSNTNEGVIMQPSLVFTTVNWSAPQTVTVRGVDDSVADGNQQYRAVLGPAVSDDINYNLLDAPDVVLTNVDNDKAGITVSAAAGNTTEGGGTTTFTVVLDSQPTADVSISMSSSNVNEGAVMQPSVTFTTVNWAAPQTVTVRGVDDFVADGNQPYKVILAPATGGDYAGIDPTDVDVINIDDDSPGFIVTPTTGLETDENGKTATFTVRLTSQPLNDVLVGVHSSDVTEGATNLALLTFTAANYNSPQTVTVKGLNDDVADGNQTYRVILDPAMSMDGNYNSRDPEDVTVSNTDNDSAGITVTPTTGLKTSEKLETATFTVALTSQPTGDVTVPILSSNTAEGTVSPASITFTSSNWRSPVTVTITGVDDPVPVQDGDRPYIVRVGPVTTSADANYLNLSGPDVNVINVDNDSAGITVSPTGGLVTGENGDSATFTVVLNSQPSGDVTVPITSSNTLEGTALPTSLTFTSNNWSSPKTVTVRGVDDTVPTKDGNKPYVVHVGPVATSADPNYVGKFADVSATNIDNDSAGITVSPISGLTTGENGDTATFTVVLTSLPSGDVSVPISSSDTTEGTVVQSLLTFTAANWSSPKTVTIRGVDDPVPVQDGNRPYVIHVGPVMTSADLNYVGATGHDVDVINIDNDSAGISASVTSGLTTSEDGTSTTFTVVLHSQPSGDVTIPISSSNTNEGNVSPASIVFTSNNWSSPQTVTLTGVNDPVPVEDGNQPYTVHVGPIATSVDPNYLGKFVDVSATNIDNDSAGIIVTAAPGLTTSENADKATFTVVLTTKPSGDVQVPLTSSDTTEGAVSPNVVTFTNANWSSPRTITVTGVNDPIPVQDGDKPYKVHVGPITVTADPNYSNVAGADVSLVNIDNDSAGITVSVSSGLTTSEDGTTATFTVVLNSQPSGTVTVPVTSSNGAEGTIFSTPSLVFDGNSWSSPQTVTVKGADDSPPVKDGDKPYVVHVGPITMGMSNDPNYVGKFADVAAVNLDNDSAGFTLAPLTALTTNENGATAKFTVVLKSVPSGNVSVPVQSLLTSEGQVSTGVVNFNAGNWSTPITVTVTGINDSPPVLDGDKPYVVRVGPITTSDDPNFVGVPLQDLSFINVDDDSAGITVTPTSGLVTTESGGTATFTVVLNTVPSGTVTVPVTSSNLGEGTVGSAGNPGAEPFLLTFNSGDWNVPHTVTVHGLNDNPPAQDGDASYDISVGPVTSSADLNYIGISGHSVSLTNTDNDIAAILLSTSAITTSESGTSASFTVVLATLPAGTVTVPVTGLVTTEGTLTATVGATTISTPLVFTTADWNIQRTITITGVNDPVPVVDGDQTYTLTIGPATTVNDANYVGKSGSVQVTNTDDDTAGLIVTPPVCATTSSTITTLSMSLRTMPSDDVSVSLSVNDATIGSVVTMSPLLFTSMNWNTPQPVDVTGGMTAGTFMVIANPDSNTDTNYKNVTSWGGTCTNTP